MDDRGRSTIIDTVECLNWSSTFQDQRNRIFFLIFFIFENICHDSCSSSIEFEGIERVIDG